MVVHTGKSFCLFSFFPNIINWYGGISSFIHPTNICSTAAWQCAVLWGRRQVRSVLVHRTLKVYKEKTFK